MDTNYRNLVLLFFVIIYKFMSQNFPAQPLGWPVLLFIAIKKVYGLI
jgi:hypothetical protein